VFEWDAFLTLAEELASRPGDEAAARSAISRAYYAAFHAGRAYLRQVNMTIDVSGTAHRQVRQALLASNREVSQNLARLHELRKEADYDNPSSFDVDRVAPLAVALARSTIEAIRALT
jgi:uncharacterized protein (UPF0332 family)